VIRISQAEPLIRFAYQQLKDHLPPRALLASALALMGRNDDARVAGKDALTINLTVTSHLKFMKLVKQADAARLTDGMRTAGFPE